MTLIITTSMAFAIMVTEICQVSKGDTHIQHFTNPAMPSELNVHLHSLYYTAEHIFYRVNGQSNIPIIFVK